MTARRFSPLRVNLHYSTYDGLAAMPAVFLLTPGNFVIAALLTGFYELPPAAYGAIVSMPFWCNFLQLAAAPLLARFSPQRLSVASIYAQSFLLGGLALAMFWLPRDQPAQSGPWLTLIFAGIGVATAVAGVAWTSFIQEAIPERVRSRYFGRRNQMLQASHIAFLIVGGLLLRRASHSVLAFQLVLAGAVGLRLLSAWYQQHMTTPVRATMHVDAAPLPWRAQFDALRRMPSFFWFVAFGAAWGFAANCIGPFYTVFLYEQLGLTIDDVMWLTVLVGAGSMVSYPAWGALAHRFGNKPVIFFALILWQAQNCIWCFITTENTWLLYPMYAFGGVMTAGVLLGMFNIVLKLIPVSAKTVAISLNIAVTSLVTAVAPIIGGALLQWLLASGRDPLELYHQLFLVQPAIAVLACVVLLSRVHEPKAGELTTVFGAMRNARTLGSIFGLTSLVNFVFVKNVKDKTAHSKIDASSTRS